MRMSGFGSLSDDELSAAVDDIISEAKDLCALEQVAKINCSEFSGSDLPDELETRFRKLKSFPVSSKSRNPIDLENRKPPGECQGGSFTVAEKNHPDGKPGLDEQGGSVSSGSGSSGFWADQVASDPHCGEKLFMDSPSPPRRVGCFWFSPKKALKRMSIGSRSFDMGKKSEEDFVGSDLGSLSMKVHEKIMRKMRKQDEKIAKEAEKIVEWAKQASARMSYRHADDDELSDC